jgi:hypothetical protein
VESEGVTAPAKMSDLGASPQRPGPTEAGLDTNLSGAREEKPVRLYSPGQVLAATILGAPVAGAILLAHNYRSVGQGSAGRKALLWGGLGTVGLLIVSLFLLEHFPNSVLPASYSMGMYQLAKQLQGREVASHLAAGGARGSNWSVVGIGVACLLVLLVVMIGVAVVVALAGGQ